MHSELWRSSYGLAITSLRTVVVPVVSWVVINQIDLEYIFSFKKSLIKDDFAILTGFCKNLVAAR